MSIRFYSEDGTPVGTVENPDDLKQRIPMEDIDRFTFDAGDLAQWEAAERVNAVRQEAQRRMMTLVGARSEEHLDIIISNGSREAIRLLRKGQKNWTAEETQRAGALAAIDQAIEGIRAASNVLEVMDPVPNDYADDMWWAIN